MIGLSHRLLTRLSLAMVWDFSRTGRRVFARAGNGRPGSLKRTCSVLGGFVERERKLTRGECVNPRPLCASPCAWRPRFQNSHAGKAQIASSQRCSVEKPRNRSSPSSLRRALPRRCELWLTRSKQERRDRWRRESGWRRGRVDLGQLCNRRHDGAGRYRLERRRAGNGRRIG